MTDEQIVAKKFSVVSEIVARGSLMSCSDVTGVSAAVVALVDKVTTELVSSGCFDSCYGDEGSIEVAMVYGAMFNIGACCESASKLSGYEGIVRKVFDVVLEMDSEGILPKELRKMSRSIASAAERKAAEAAAKKAEAEAAAKKAAEEKAARDNRREELKARLAAIRKQKGGK